MAVFTSLQTNDVEQFLLQYKQGSLNNYTGISAGTDNSNYFVTTTHGNFVLTLFEHLPVQRLMPIIDIMHRCTQHQLPVANVVANAKGTCLGTLKEKPALLIQKMPGIHPKTITNQHIQPVAIAMACLHKLFEKTPIYLPNLCDTDWMNNAIVSLTKHLSQQERHFITSQLMLHSDAPLDKLPKTIIHADLFTDNVLFESNRLTAIIDFYFSCYDTAILDLATMCNDWCWNNGTLNQKHVRCLLTAYQSKRTLSALEKRYFPVVLQLSALRFYVSRLLEQRIPKQQLQGHIKDPEEYKIKLQQLQHQNLHFF